MRKRVRWSEVDGENSHQVDEQLFRKRRKLPTWATDGETTAHSPLAKTPHRQPRPPTQEQPRGSGSQPAAQSPSNTQPLLAGTSGSRGQASTSTQAPTPQSGAFSAQEVPLPASPVAKKRKASTVISEETLNGLSKKELRKMHGQLLKSLQELEAAEDGDTENDAPQVQYPQRRKRIRGGPPKVKRPERNKLVVSIVALSREDWENLQAISSTKHDVHEYANILFGLAGPGANDKLPPSPDFPDGPPPSSVRNFRYAWTKPRSHHFNQGAANCFARAMIDSEDYDYGEGKFKELKDAFITYADRTLKERWKREISGGSDSYDVFSRKRADSARSRRRRLFYDRRKVLSTVKSLSPWLVLVDALGIAGMSSDEEDTTATDGRRYIIARKTWRAPEVTRFLRTLDELFTELKLEKRGQDRRLRVERAARSSHTEAVGGLPANCYSEDWLERTPGWKLALFGIQQDREANFELPGWVNEFLAVREGNGGEPSSPNDDDGDHAMQGQGSSAAQH